jgi:hypothetical protein
VPFGAMTASEMPVPKARTRVQNPFALNGSGGGGVRRVPVID